MIRITSQREGFRRCGVAHSAQPTDYPDARWSAAELARLQAEPMLVVERLGAAAAPPAAQGAPAPTEGLAPASSRRAKKRSTTAP